MARSFSNSHVPLGYSTSAGTHGTGVCERCEAEIPFEWCESRDGMHWHRATLGGKRLCGPVRKRGSK